MFCSFMYCGRIRQHNQSVKLFYWAKSKYQNTNPKQAPKSETGEIPNRKLNHVCSLCKGKRSILNKIAHRFDFVA